MAKKLIIANLKMNLESISMREDYIAQAQEFFGVISDATVVVCPPHAYLERFANVVDALPVTLGAQDCFWELHGSYTGQVSPRTLRDFEVSHVILGHSELRGLGESNERIAKKAAAALRQNLIPVVCVGYVGAGEDEAIAIEKQVTSAVTACAPEDRHRIVFAYEPVWAIGSGKTPSGQDIHSRVILIRRSLENAGVAAENVILYGGSVRAENAAELCNEGHVDGFIVGGASLRPEEFARIVKNVTNVTNH